MNKIFEQFVGLFEAENHKLNLCKFEGRKEFFARHIMDSLECAQFFSNAKKVLDLGTGGGLPGLVLAIQRPDIQFTLVDSINKKCTSVQEMVKTLALKNVIVKCARAEDLAHDPIYREKFDMVIARAVAPLPTLLELGSGFVRRGGVFIAYKGPKYAEELPTAKNAMAITNFDLEKIHHYRLSGLDIPFTLLLFTKNRPLNSNYPRQNGLPSKKPL
ncbi:MAG: ribosomal RNA small subunit methyltransferase G [Candidatus Peregrinibacteria bacterium GW2011_GWF2_43_17]|nr:MAG: ribosomal RNA small subunit methyltransferase G [Candidatus Peregrinibacteria bacterium GW2011_GWF2_43_17]KKT20205.1 MAG: Ribosomal RNA small subunit methyltransferase G [Candidatus Peregrinibacteria bacterium GW2011_GWA2_43_8]HAU39766.1 16S rRNA (guanine(527)-N(7))-methyltransferase RsmG [Candidatus Peregrinibacteria bacterium]